MKTSMKTAWRSWTTSLTDFYKESFPPPEDDDSDDEEDEQEYKGTDWMALWALCVSMGIPDRDWENVTIPKIRALSKIKKQQNELEVILHGGTINKKPKKAKFLSDLGIFK